MSDPELLLLEHVLLIHKGQIAKFGGAAAVRDRGLSVSSRPRPSLLGALAL